MIQPSLRQLPLLVLISLWPTASSLAGGLDGLAPKVELKVYDDKSGKLLFIGKERNEMTGDTISRVTTYTDPAGKKLQEERVKYNAATLRILSQSSRNFVTGTKVDMSPVKGHTDPKTTAVMLQFQESGKESPKTKKLTSDNLYVGNVMHHLIKRNWQQLTKKNEMVVIKLVAPTRLDYYTFRLSSKKADAEKKVVKKVVKKTTSTDGTASTVTTTTETNKPKDAGIIVLEPDSWIIRSLVDPMEFYYEDGRLREFRGITPVVVDDNPYRRTRFQFNYPAP